MSDILDSTTFKFGPVFPELDVDQDELTGLVIEVTLFYEDKDNVPAGSRIVMMDAWGVLTPEQQNNVEDIFSTIKANVLATYFGTTSPT